MFATNEKICANSLVGTYTPLAIINDKLSDKNL